MRAMTLGVFQREASYLAPEWQGAHDLYDAALKVVLSDSRVTSAMVGVRFPEEAEQNAKVAEEWHPPVDFVAMPRLTVEVYKVEDAR